MASHLIAGAPLTVSAKETVWQLAEEIADELDACPARLPDITKLIDRLGRLRPPGQSSPRRDGLRGHRLDVLPPHSEARDGPDGQRPEGLTRSRCRSHAAALADQLIAVY
jgi:hypothetical protein